VSSMPYGRHVPRESSDLADGQADDGRPGARWLRDGWRAWSVSGGTLAQRQPHRGWRGGIILTGTLAVCAALFPGATAQASPSSGPTLKQIEAKANKLSEQIDNLSEQYDGLQIQLTQARQEVKIARENATRDAQLLGTDRAYINAIAVNNYMTGGLNPTLQLLQSTTPQAMLDRASIITQLQHEAGAKVNLVATAQVAAQRAQAAANQEEQRAVQLKATMAKTVAKIQARENVLNSQAFAQAAAIFQQTGHYPITSVQGNSIGVQALNHALTRIGDPYVWAAAGPSEFDCSGLVMWAYDQVGVHLLHFTGDQWNEGEHIPRSELEPGDLVFFYAAISHVGLYVGNGLMVDAPSAGQDVQIQPIDWANFVGAVRIIA
jgi:cell wall-associated NlpC family hydrolase